MRYVTCKRCGADRPSDANCGACGYDPAAEKLAKARAKEADRIVHMLAMNFDDGDEAVIFEPDDEVVQRAIAYVAASKGGGR